MYLYHKCNSYRLRIAYNFNMYKVVQYLNYSHLVLRFSISYDISLYYLNENIKPLCKYSVIRIFGDVIHIFKSIYNATIIRGSIILFQSTYVFRTKLYELNSCRRFILINTIHPRIEPRSTQVVKSSIFNFIVNIYVCCFRLVTQQVSTYIFTTVML